MPKEIKNKKVEVPANQSLNDMDILNDVLLNFKQLINNQIIALNEASNQYIYDEYFKIFSATSDVQAKLFEVAFQKGWYILEEEDQPKIQKKYDEYLQKESEL